MSLAKTLQQIKEAAGSRIPEAERNLMARATAELRESGIMESALKVGMELPGFELPAVGGEMVSSAELLKDHNLVLTFYRGVW
jgi:hypothetical protein